MMKSANPATDPHLTYNHSAKDLKAKRKTNAFCKKKCICRNVRIRFCDGESADPAKGRDLLVDALENFLVQNNVQSVILGTGDRDLEEDLLSLQDRFPGNYGSN